VLYVLTLDAVLCHAYRLEEICLVVARSIDAAVGSGAFGYAIERVVHGRRPETLDVELSVWCCAPPVRHVPIGGGEAARGLPHVLCKTHVRALRRARGHIDPRHSPSEVHGLVASHTLAV